MDKNIAISEIKKVPLSDTEILHISLENNKSFRTGEMIIDNLPEFYRIILKSTPGKGSLIITELWLPENWNGRFVGLGNGGMAGNINHWGIAHYVKQGYAAAQTDLGTSRGRDSGIDNPDVHKDFGWRATHLMTVLSKQIIRAHYGKKEKYSYFIGGSTGGQQAFSEAQRFPEDYDGILSEVPANNRIFLHTYFLWNHNHLRTRDGKVMFTDEEINRINSYAVKYFQEHNDGEKNDNFVSYPYHGADTVSGFMKYIEKMCPDFDDTQLSALNAVYEGPVNPVTGDRIYNGMPIGSEIYSCGIASHQEEESPHFYPFIWTFGKDYDGYEFDFDKDLEQVNRVLGDDLNANNPDLSKFFEKGGKILSYSGSADPCVPYPDALNYYKRVSECMGGYDKTMEFFRFFLLPGRAHGGGSGADKIKCGPSDTDDAFKVLVQWRENGIAPEMLTAVSEKDESVPAKKEFERKLYPFGSEKNPMPEIPPVCSDRYLKEVL